MNARNYPLGYLIPAGIFLLVFFFIPTIMNFIYAFTDWSQFKKEIGFAGFANFKDLL